MNFYDEENYLKVCESLNRWFQRQNYKGIDPFLLDQMIFKSGSNFVKKIRFLLKPLHPFIPRRLFSISRPIIIPKALGLIIDGNSSLYSIRPQEKYLKENYKLMNMLLENRSPNFKYVCWGWPFEWGGKIRYPRNFPLVCVTTPIGHALLNFYEITRDKYILGIVEEIAKFLLLENGYERYRDTLCFYYSQFDKLLILNANAMAGSFLLKLSAINKNEDYRKIGTTAVRFNVKEQNDDGSWYYASEKSHLKGFMIDNRHTGFILEALFVSNRILKKKTIQESIDHGWDFYKRHLFESEVPKWSVDKTYPCDIHDVAQSIITTVELGYLDFAQEVIEFALEKFFNGQDEFYYKLFKNGKVNKTVFFRWNQAWMFRALTLFLEKKNEESNINLSSA